MTLDRHKLDGRERIQAKTLPTEVFEQRLIQARYSQIGTDPAKGN
ncbi:MAG: hypothetical protein ACRDEA_06760 [Microcystaceae cyanobacterium]